MPRQSLNAATLSADGSTNTVPWSGGRGTFAGYGTFGGGTLSLEISYDQGTTWFAVGTDTDLTSDGHGNFDLPSGVLLRGTLSGATSPSLTVEIRPRPQQQV